MTIFQGAVEAARAALNHASCLGTSCVLTCSRYPGFVPVAFHHRRCVQIEKVHGGGGVNLPGLGEITRGHVPALAHLAVGDLRVAIAAVIMVAQGDMPRNLQGRGVVNIFKRSLPLRIAGRGHAVFVEIVADGDDKLRLEGVCGDAHLRRHVHLIGLAVPPPIAENQEIQAAGRGVRHVGGPQGVRQETADHDRLGGYKENANEFTAGLFHKPASDYSAASRLKIKIGVTSQCH